jgi:hypothetical protein
MRNGQTLHLRLSSRDPLWSLSDGSAVPAEVATLLFLDSVSLEPVSCPLSICTPAQTWSYAHD